MKSYSIMTVVAQFPLQNNLISGQPISIAVSLPNNATPLQVEYRPGMGNIPSGCAVHYLVPCDESGNIIEEEEFTPVNIFKQAWGELYKVFSERMQQEELDLMDAVMSDVLCQLKDEEKMRQESEDK